MSAAAEVGAAWAGSAASASPGPVCTVLEDARSSARVLPLRLLVVNFQMDER